MRLKLVLHNECDGADVGDLVSNLTEGLTIDTFRNLLGIWLYEVTDHDYLTFDLRPNSVDASSLSWDSLVRRYLTLRTIRQAPNVNRPEARIRANTEGGNRNQPVPQPPLIALQYALNELREYDVQVNDLVILPLRAARPYDNWQEPLLDFFELHPTTARWAEVNIWAPHLNFRETITVHTSNDLRRIGSRISGRAAWIDLTAAGTSIPMWI
jgi:hypothetical protein